MKTCVLTGITTSGTPHLGNYVGAIRPAVQASLAPNTEAFFFLADYHALIKCEDPNRIARSRIEIAATWLAAGLDPNHVFFYRQSDIPEIPELSWLLTCVTGKGLMNRAHAYKASVDANRDKNAEEDDGITMGLFSYPILMAADILMFNAHFVPVGRDQIQHIEMTRDIAQRFNHLFGGGRELFVLPEAMIQDDNAILQGLDGRKMSKSYNNTIPLFEGGVNALQSAVAKIVTDSKGPGEAKNAELSNLFPIFKAFATPEEVQVFTQSLEQGLSWGEAKKALCTQVESSLSPLRGRYADLMAHPDDLEDILLAGAKRARARAAPFMAEIRHAVGLQSFKASTETSSKKQVSNKHKTVRFVSYRDVDQQFRFRLLDQDGRELFVSLPHADPKQAGVIMRQLQQRTEDVTVEIESDTQFIVCIEELCVGQSAVFDSIAQRDEVLQHTQAAIQALNASSL
jgi:tryptophanyl-tRNA synthetase